MESVIKPSLYLQGRQHNAKMLDKIGQALTPHIVEYNTENPEDQITVEWSMSAKHQSGTIQVEMSTGDDITPPAEDFILGKLSVELEEWFDCGFDDEDISDTYASAMVGF